MKSGKFNFFFFVLVLALTVLVLVVSRSPKQVARKRSTDQLSQPYWTCTMHPRVQEVAPGRCPICHMSLIKVD